MCNCRLRCVAATLAWFACADLFLTNFSSGKIGAIVEVRLMLARCIFLCYATYRKEACRKSDGEKGDRVK